MMVLLPYLRVSIVPLSKSNITLKSLPTIIFWSGDNSNALPSATAAIAGFCPASCITNCSRACTNPCLAQGLSAACLNSITTMYSLLLSIRLGAIVTTPFFCGFSGDTSKERSSTNSPLR